MRVYAVVTMQATLEQACAQIFHDASATNTTLAHSKVHVWNKGDRSYVYNDR